MSSVFHRNLRSLPTMAEQAAGSFIIHERGSVVDLSAGAGVACLGQNVWPIADAMKKQIDTLPYIHAGSFTSQSVEKAGVSIIDALGPWFLGGKVAFYSGGAEAVEAACKLAAQVQRRRSQNEVVFISRQYSYHGNTAFCLQRGDHPRSEMLHTIGMARGGRVWKFVANSPHLSMSYEESNSLRSLSDCLENAMESGLSPIVLLEPVGGTASAISPASPTYLTKVRNMCDAARAVLVYDEILCGNYRTGQFNAWQHYAPSSPPDIVVMGKGISGGYFPVSAVAAREWVVDSVRASHRPYLAHTSTNQNNPIGCAAVVAAMKLYRDYHSHLSVLADRVITAVAEIRKIPHVKFAQGVGSLYGVGFAGNAGTAKEIKAQLLESGVSVYADGGLFHDRFAMLLLAPPIHTSEHDLGVAVKAIANLRLTPISSRGGGVAFPGDGAMAGNGTA